MPGSSEICKRTIRLVSPSPQGEICQSETQPIPGSGGVEHPVGDQIRQQVLAGVHFAHLQGFSAPRTIAQAGI